MFRVTNTAEAARQFRDLLHQATAAGKKDPFTESAGQLARDLSLDPMAVGESREERPAAGFTGGSPSIRSYASATGFIRRRGS